MLELVRASIVNGLHSIAARMVRDPTWPHAQRVPYSGRTIAGIRITPDSAVTLPAVWACLRYLSQTVGVMPWHVLREGNNGAEVANKHPIDYLISQRVSDEWSSFQFRETLTHWALRWGNGYAEIEPDQAGRPFALWPIHPERVYVCRATQDSEDAYGEPIRAGQLFYEISQGMSYGAPSGNVALSQKRVFHVRGFGEGPVGVNVISYAAESLGWAKAAQLFGASFFGNGANVSAIVLNKKPLSPDGLKRQRAQFDQLYRGPRNANKTAILDADADIKMLGLDAEKSQLVNVNQALVAEICFVPGTKIITADGILPIEVVTAGQSVLTHKGRWRKVRHAMSRDYNGEVVTLQAKGLAAVTSTANHPFHVQSIKRTRTNALVVNDPPQWREAAQVRVMRRRKSDGRRTRHASDCLMIPRLGGEGAAPFIDMAKWVAPTAVYGLSGSKIKFSARHNAGCVNRYVRADAQLGWLCGLFAADGTTSDHQVRFYLGAHEEEIAASLCACLQGTLGIRGSIARKRSMIMVTVSNKIAARFFGEFGKESEKHFPPWAMARGAEFMKGAIEGLIAGDGHRRRGNVVSVHNTSETLVWQLRLFLWSVGINSSVHRQSAATWSIDGRTGLSKEIWNTEWRSQSDRRGTLGVTDDHVFMDVQSAERSHYCGTVHNLEVEDDESYCTLGGEVHNCRWFGVPPHKVMDLTRATFSNIEHQAIEVVVDSVSPWAKRFEDEADFKLFGPQNRQQYYTKMNMRGLMRGDIAARVAYYDGMVKIGAYSPNRVLELEDENTIGPDGDIHVMQNQNVTLEQIAAGVGIPASQPATPPAAPETDQGPLGLSSAELAAAFERLDMLAEDVGVSTHV